MKLIHSLMVSFLLLAVPAVYGQDFQAGSNDAVLAQGQPPLTQGMVDRLAELFEWILDGRFTAAQRTQFQNQRIEEWRRNDRSSIDNVLNLLQVRSQVDGLADDQRNQARAKLQTVLLNTLRKQPDDETSRLLLAVYENGQRQNADGGRPAGGEEATNSPEAQATGAPSELLGRWQAGTVSSTTFVNRTTGSYSAPSGTQVMYTIFPDGRYEYAALTQQSMYSCTTRLLTYKTGVVIIQGSTLTFTPKTGKFSSEDNGNRRYNYEKPASFDQETYRWRVEQDQYGIKLCLQNDKVNGCAYKR